MQKKGYLAAIFGVVLTAGLFLAGCDLTTNPGNNSNPSTGNSGELDGTWKKGIYEIIIDDDSYVMKSNETNYGKGTITYSVANSTFTFRSTHAWNGSSWVSYTETTSGKLTYNGGNTLTISNLDNYEYSSLAGTWTKQSPSTGNTDPKTIVITGFPGSTYSGRFAMVMLSPSFLSIAEEEMTAMGIIQVSGTSLSFPLYRDSDMTARWNGTGDNVILLGIVDIVFNPSTEEITSMKLVKMFVYSPGVTPNSTWSNIPKYNITEKTSSIPFNNNFYDITDEFPEDMFDGYY
jgi:hypothetical protein